jgi:hypothetical protein
MEWASHAPDSSGPPMTKGHRSGDSFSRWIEMTEALGFRGKLGYRRLSGDPFYK